MKTDQYPVVITGKLFHVDCTFSGSPGVYVYHDGAFRHMSNLDGSEHDGVIHAPQNGDTVIFATMIAEDIEVISPPQDPSGTEIETCQDICKRPTCRVDSS